MLSIVILAAGQGTRMHSSLPKVLHPLAGQPLLQHVLTTANQLPHRGISIVYGYGGEQVKAACPATSLSWVEQCEQLGTGHAVAQAMPGIPDEDMVLVLYGDVPLTRLSTLEQLLAAAEATGFGLLTAELPDPAGYGRIVRTASGKVQSIVEQKDATAAQLAITEINSGMLAVSSKHLRRWIAALDNNNNQREYYLTDVIGMAVAEGMDIATVQPVSLKEIQGVNNRLQLAELERYYQHQQAENLLLAGVTLHDPGRFDLRGSLQAGRDVSIDINAVLIGNVILGHGVCIGANCVIRNSEIEAGTVIEPNCMIDQARIGKKCRIGPFARIRPEAILADDVHVGNFVEIKKSSIGHASKINHLSYIGDSEIGKSVNIGAGTITCNYDGANKFKTIIEDDVFVGSDTQMVAPVRIAAGATIAAGTTVTKDVEAGSLAVSRTEQRSVKNWKRPRNNKNK